MTTTPPDSPAESPTESSAESPTESPTDGGPRVTRDEVRDLGRLRRTTGDRKVAGVAGGLARHLDIDPIVLRVGFVVLAFFGGSGLILYVAGWILLPEEDRERAPVHLDERSRTVALVALTVIATLALVGDSWGAFWFPWPLVVIGLIALVWLSRSRDRDRQPGAAVGYRPAPGEASYGAPAVGTYRAPRPRNPRKRGPVLFWFTLLLIGVAVGVLGIVDGAGAPVTDSAYVALPVAVIAAMLLLGSVVGRAGGLIALGLVGSVVLAAATAAERFDGERYEYRPSSSAQVDDSYTMGDGELVVDLTGVADLDGLDGRTLDIRGNIGEIVVLVPEEVSVRVDVEIDGPGGYDLFDRQSGGGFSSSTTARHEGRPGAPDLTIDADLELGQITVDTE